MPASRLGEIAALGTAVCWTGSALSFASAGKRIGSIPTNLIRLVFALAFLVLANTLARGVPLPVDASGYTWRILALSGFIGLVFGDLCLFRAYVVLGPRLTLLVNATAPFFTALLSWFVLGERLSTWQVLGMTLTAAGIGIAFAEHRSAAREQAAPPASLRGLLLALGGAVGQAGGLVFSKLGMRGYPPLAATEIRVLVALASFLVLFTIFGWWPGVADGLRHGSGLAFTALGAFFGPTAGVALSLVAVANAPAGVASSLMALSPLLVLPVVALRGERVGWGGALGALVAVGGVVLLVTS